MRKLLIFVAIVLGMARVQIVSISAQSLDYHLNQELTEIEIKTQFAGLEISTQSLPYPEIIFTNSNAITSLSFDAETGQYLENWTHVTKVDDDHGGYYVSAFFHREFNMLDREVIVYIYGNYSHLVAIDKKTGDLLLHHLLEITTPSGIDVADFDKDGIPDLFLHNRSGIYIFDIISGNRLKHIDYIDYNDAKICVSQFDSDISLEVVIGNGDVIDIDSGEIQWNIDHSLGQFKCGDLDRDGIDELVNQSYNQLLVYDVDQKSIKWRKTYEKRTDMIQICDYRADGNPDIVTGNSQEKSKFTCYNGLTGAELWHCETTIESYMDFQVADLDVDGADELVVCDSADFVHIVDPMTGEFKFVTRKYQDFETCSQISDFNNDGILDLGTVTVSDFGEGFYTSYHQLIDPTTFRLKDRYKLSEDLKVTHMQTLNFVDSSIGQEHFIMGYSSDSKIIRMLDAEYKLLWEQHIGSHEAEYFQTADLDGDGDLEIVVMNDSIRIYDATSGHLAGEYIVPH